MKIKRILALAFVLQFLLMSISVTVTAEAASEVDILNHTSYLDYDGYYHVVGEVTNLGEQAVNSVNVTAAFYHSNDTIIATESTYTYVNVLLSGRKAPFEIILANPTQAAQVDYYSLTMNYSATEAPLYGLEILSNSLYVDGGGWLHAVGETKNIGEQTATNVKMIATFYDETGKILDCRFAYSYPDELAPSQTATFDIVLTRIGIVPSVDSYVLTAESDQYALIPETSNLVVNVVDNEDQPISGANVTVTRTDGWETSNITENGVAHFLQLTTGNYSIEASFQSFSNTTTINLVEDTEVFLKLNSSLSGTFEVTVDVVWSDETPVFNASVVIRDSDGQALKTSVTDANGTYTTSLSEGEYTIEVSKGTMSDTKNVTIVSETVIPFTFNTTLTMHTLTVNVVGDDGSIIDGALVEVNLDGTTVASSETGGNTVFELAEETYQIVVTWNNEQNQETVELTEDKEYSIVLGNNEQNEDTIDITEYNEEPTPVQRETPFDFTIYIIAIVTVSATICVLALYIRRRRQRMNPFYDLHP